MTVSINTEYKTLIVGPAEVGKTAWIKRLESGDFPNVYTPTTVVEVHPLEFRTQDGSRIKFNVWDCAGDDSQFVEAKCAFIVGGPETELGKFVEWQNRVLSICPDIPIEYVRTKKDIDASAGHISAYTNYRTEKPFHRMARRLTENQNLQFAALPAIFPPEVPNQ